jgi:hypothetical protein
MFFLVQEMEKEKQDHKQKMSALIQTHNQCMLRGEADQTKLNKSLV